jgi:DNA-binding LacI/PurR family transcriptional regulator
VRYLIELGHQRIGYIGERNGRTFDTERFGGYRMALDGAGVPFAPELIVYGDGSLEGGRQAMAQLLSLDPRPTAVFCYDDMTALGAVSQSRSIGLHVPEDLSVIGFDDLSIVQYTDPPLTTVRQPMADMGRLAMETLLDLLAGSTASHTIKLPGQLIVRGSTAPPREERMLVGGGEG